MAADPPSTVPADPPTAPTEAPPTPVAPTAVTRERVDDPLTGLPLLRYAFPGHPTLRPGDPGPVGAWRVLRTEERDGTSVLDLETNAGAEPLADRAHAIDDAVAEAALATLADAGARGIAHGDLGPHRLWRRGDRVWIEGYGVPWHAAATPDADARTLASGLLAIAGTRLSPTVRARLAAVRDGGDPTAGATADPPPPTATPEPTPLPQFVRGPPPGATVRRADGSLWHDAQVAATATAAAASRATRGAARRVAATSARAATAVSAALANRRTGGVAGAAPSAAPGGRPLDDATGVATAAADRRRRGRLALALVVSATAWLALASWAAQRPVAPTLVTRTVGHVVEVRIEPAGLPPVSLIVVESPGGSRLMPGSVVGSVPSKVLLDREGVWRFQARFGDRRSQVVALVAPSETVLVVPFPATPPAAAP